MLVIRLRRIGRKHDPHYRIVVAEHTSPVQGKFIAEIGHFHPKSKETVIRQDQLTDWISKGAKPSNTVAKLCIKQGITGNHIVVKQYHGQPKKKAQEAAAAKAEAANKPAETPKEAEVAETPEEDTVTEETPAEEEAVAEETTEEATEDTAETPEEQPTEEVEEPTEETPTEEAAE